MPYLARVPLCAPASTRCDRCTRSISTARIPWGGWKYTGNTREYNLNNTTEYKLNTRESKLNTREHKSNTMEYKLNATEYKLNTTEYKLNTTTEYTLDNKREYLQDIEEGAIKEGARDDSSEGGSHP